MTMKTKQQLFAQKVISVVNCDFPTPDMVEFMGEIGFDALFIDCEHSHTDFKLVNELARAARVALLHSWQSTQTEGWWRIALDQNKVPYDYIDPEVIGKTANLREKYDVILVGPGVTQAAIDGQPMWGNPTPWKNSADTPSIGTYAQSDDTRVGMQLEGLIHLRDFVNQGGVLVAATTSASTFISGGIIKGVTAQIGRAHV